jgi:hypothetical protein
MTVFMPKNGAPRQPPMPQTPEEGADPSSFEHIWIKVVYLIALMALYFALAKTYTEFLQPLFKYQHFKQNFVPTREVASLIVLCVAAAVMPANFRRPSDLFVSLAIVVTLVPTAMMNTYGSLSSETAFVTYAGLAVIFLAREIPTTVRVWPDCNALPIHAFTALSILGVVTTAYQMGFDSFSLDLVDVYGRRAIAYSKLNGISKYIVFLALNSNLIAVLMSFICRRWVSLVVNLTASFLFFGLMGNKAAFYGSIIFIIISVILQSRFCIVFIVSCLSGVAVCYYLFFMNREYITFAELYQQRNLILPVYINDLYLNDFSYRKLYWAYSKLSLGLIDNPLSLDPATSVAYHWVGRTTTHANTGFVGSGYMNAGFIGILIYAVVIGLCCRVIDVFAQIHGTKSFAALICLPGFLNAVTSSDLPTVLFSGGWSLAILVTMGFDPAPQRLVRWRQEL